MGNEPLLITAEMGLGHLRALKPFEKLPEKKVLVLGQTSSSSKGESFIWRTSLRTYEWFSKARQVPLIGPLIFSLLDSLLAIKETPNGANGNIYQLKLLNWFIELGACNELQKEIEYQGYKQILTSFYAPVHFAAHKLNNQKVFCQICDTDLSRVWVPKNPKAENLYYFAPCVEAVSRLKEYGVDPSKIHFTGFPLPDELVGGKGQGIAIENYTNRLSYLKDVKLLSSQKPIKIAYVIGGAGAMIGLAKRIAKSLKEEIHKGTVVLTIVPNPRNSVTETFLSFKKRNFKKCNGLQILVARSYDDYFKKFNSTIADTHILWTKPSELTFYSSLGIPIIMAPPLGPQERANRNWLIKNNVAIDQPKPQSSRDWLSDLLDSGMLVPMAKNGWVQGKRIAKHEISSLLNYHMNSNGQCIRD